MQQNNHLATQGARGINGDAVMVAYMTLAAGETAAAIAKKVTEMFALVKPSPYQDSDPFTTTRPIRRTHKAALANVRLPFEGICIAICMTRVLQGDRPQTMGIVGVAVPRSRCAGKTTQHGQRLVIDAVRSPIK